VNQLWGDGVELRIWSGTYKIRKCDSMRWEMGLLDLQVNDGSVENRLRLGSSTLIISNIHMYYSTLVSFFLIEQSPGTSFRRYLTHSTPYLLPPLVHIDGL
jgi:hypothetical protein